MPEPTWQEFHNASAEMVRRGERSYAQHIEFMKQARANAAAPTTPTSDTWPVTPEALEAAKAKLAAMLKN